MLKYFTILVFLLHITSGVMSQADFYAFNQIGVRLRIDSLKKALPFLKDT